MGSQAGVTGGGNLGEQVKVVNSLSSVSKDVDFDSTGIDRLGYNAAIISINLGAKTANPVWAFTIQESDAVGAGYTDAVVGSFGAVTGAASDTQNVVVNITVDCRKLKRYIRVHAVLTGAGAASFISVSAVLGAADQLPVA
jgi:hypothetical protein